MTSPDLRLLVDYGYWARDRMLMAVAELSPDDYVRPMVTSFGSVRETLNHMYLAEWIWNRRWHGDSPTGPPEYPLEDLEELRQRWAENEASVRALLENLGDRDVLRIVDYRLSSGEHRSTPLWQLVVHVVNHSTYHRGQVTTLLRQLGADPPESTDMITYFKR